VSADDTGGQAGADLIGAGRLRPLAFTWRLLIGRPLKSSEARHGEITPLEGLPALSLDALTSVAYGPEAIVLVLGTAGVAALHLVLPVTIAIVALLALLVTSYRQVIDGYPHGGGAYAVSRANLGVGASQVAAASLVVDYTLTVAVSIAAGIAALTSAFPALAGATVPLCLAELAVLTVFNLRGLGETARAFLLPTFLFIVGLLAVITIGIVHPLDPNLAQSGTSQTATINLAPVGVLLILKAFSAGCSALTGVEAIANGVPLFRPPRQTRAKQTELLLGVLLGVMLIGLAVLVRKFHVGPRTGQTVLSQVMAYSVGRGWLYYVVSISITVVLGLAANTSFGGLPVLASLLSRDHYLPHAFALRGDRLVFSKGIWALAVAAALLLVIVRGNTNTLIPLFAIGVFIGFTLAQTGMVVHWWQDRPLHWRRKATLNGVGAAVTAVATLVFLVSKFVEGAWVVVVVIPLLIVMFHRIRAYYGRLGEVLGIGAVPPPPRPGRVLVIVPVNGVTRLTSFVISEALSVGDDVIALAVTFSDEVEREAELDRAWREWNSGVRLVTLRSQYHSVARPILRFINAFERRENDYDHIIVLIPVIQPDKWYQRIFHNQLDLVLSAALRDRPELAVTRLPVTIKQLLGLPHPAAPVPSGLTSEDRGPDSPGSASPA
jgi:amino acid transporter